MCDSTRLQLASHIMDHARQSLLLPLRFMDVAFFRLAERLDLEAEDIGLNKNRVSYHADEVLRNFKEDPHIPARVFLHMTLHAVFHHFNHPRAGEPLWQLACDMVTEHLILSFSLDAVNTSRDESQKRALAPYLRKVHPFTAETLYRHLLAEPPADSKHLAALFLRDRHLHWHEGAISGQEGGEDEDTALWRSDAYDILEEHARPKELDWEMLTSEVEMALEEMVDTIGNAASAMRQEFRSLREDTLSYDEFLRRFAQPQEAIQLNPDEFDVIFYTYGLNTYGNLPLIEPEETQEIEKIDEFVIAIDTSGSCSGDLVQAFLEKTVSLLKEGTRFHHQVNIRILQCDSRIQQETHLTNLDGLADYLRVESLHGFGGTDYRPVFKRVDALIESGAFHNLRGLLYFTDGLGVYPKYVPDYDVGFVFLDNSPQLDDPDFPPWAMKVVLSSDGLSVH